MWHAHAAPYVPRMRYFEDMQVGDRASFGSYAVTRDEVLEFARKYDAQPFHLSDEGAAATHFGRLAASGWHSCSMTMAMFVGSTDITPSVQAHVHCRLLGGQVVIGHQFGAHDLE